MTLRPLPSPTDKPDDGFAPYVPDPKTGYSPDKFYTTSTSKSEGTGTARWPVYSFPKNVLDGISQLIESGRCPAYKTKSDFFRDAVVHLLNLRRHQLQLDPEFGRQIAEFNMLAEAQRVRSINTTYRSLVDEFRSMLEEERDPATRRKFVNLLLEKLPTVQNDYYKGELLELAAKWGKHP